MSDLGTSIRRLVDETAPPIDGMEIVHRSDRRTARPGWAIGVAAGFAALAFGLLTFAVLGWGRNQAGATRISAADLPTEDLIAVADLHTGDELYRVPAGQYSVFVRIRAGEPTLLFGTSCDVVSATPLPVGWEGICLEYTSDGRRIAGSFPHGTRSDASPTSTQSAHLQPSARWSLDGIGVADPTNLLGRGSLVLRDGPVVLVADGDGETVTALDTATGEQLWQQTVDGGVVVLLGTAADSVIVGGYGLVVALDRAAGAEQWRFIDPSGALRPMAAYAGEFGIHVILDRPHEGDTDPPVVMTFDRVDGSVIWSNTLDGTGHPDLELQTGFNSSRLIFDRLFVKTTGTLHALDARTGEILWIHRFAAVPHESHGPAPILFDGVVLYVPDPNGELVALEADTGQQRWRLEVEPGYVAPVSSDGGLLVFVDGAGVHAVHSATGDRVWDHPIADTRTQAAVVGDVVVALGARQLIGLDVATGDPLWSASVDLEIGYAVLAAGDVAVAAAEDGVVAVVAGTGAILWELDRGVAEPPFIVDDSILLAHPDDQRTTALYPVRPSTTTFVWPMGWSEAPGHTVAGRTFPTTVWTGSEYIVWGGEKPSDDWHTTGAAFSPSVGRWRDLAPSPLAPRSQHAAVWTGTEVLICCGRQVGPGASAGAYQPATDAWRTIPQPPISPSFAEAVWTGSEMIVFGGVSRLGAGNLRGAAAYNPATGTWRTLADLPYGIEREAEAVLAGGVIYAWPSAGRPDDATAPLAYHIGNDTWQVLAVPSELALPLSPSLVWTGSELIAWGLAHDFGESFGVGVAFEPTTETWRSLPPTPLPATSGSDGSQGSQGAVWTGTQMIVWTGWIGSEWDDPTTAILAYDPVADSWSPLEPAPVRGAGLWQNPLIWTGTQLVVRLPVEDTVLVYTPEAMPPLG
ncbi:MAG: PQQ-binding-like beta-propeller repeat protein [Acidimicrobiia bacterium]